MRSIRAASAAVGLAAVLGVIAVLSPAPDRVTDRDIYEATAAHMIVPDCTDLHCFRVLVPWVVGRFPGPSTLWWKAYAVAANVAAAFGVYGLTMTLGLGVRAATYAAWASAIGFGSLYTLHDPYTSDPLMFALGPIMTALVLTKRIGSAAVLGAVGVFAKEFAAAPLYLMAGYQVVQRRFGDAMKTLSAANLAFIVWAALTLTLMLRFNYGWGGTDSANLGGGAGVGPWLQRQSVRGVAAAMFNEFGALYVLAPVGLLLGPAELRRLTLVSVPIAVVFGYVQQPDRALWNLHFLATPLAAIVLDAAPAAISVGTLVTFAIGNLRVGAQLPIRSLALIAIGTSLVLAVAASICAVGRAAAQRAPMSGAVAR